MKQKDSQELKGLQVRLQRTSNSLDEVSKEFKILSKNKSELEEYRKFLNSEINRIQNSNKEIIISEHAMLRYIERIKGINLDEIKTEILTPQLLSTVKTMGNGKFPSGNGFRAVVKDNTIITIEN